MEKEKFHRSIHNDMWSVCTDIQEIPKTLEDAPSWSEDAINHAAVIKE